MAEGLLNALWREILSQSATATTEISNNENEVCRRLILSGITIDAFGVITAPTLAFGVTTVPGGGTGVVTLLNHGVVIGQGVSPVHVAAVGTTGQVLTGVTGADPTFQNVLSGAFANTGTTTTVLHGNAAGTPAFSAIVNGDITNATIDLTTKVTGTLPVTNGGTGVATATSRGVMIGQGASAQTTTAAGAVGTALTGNGAAADPTFQAAAWAMDFRLSLSTVAWQVGDVTAATTLSLAPYTGNRITLYDAAGNPTTFTTTILQIAVPATTNTMYDVYVFNNAGAPALELLAWTNDTTRATLLSFPFNLGRPFKILDATRMLVGSMRTTGVSGQSEDSATKRYLSNIYNRLPRALQRFESTATWTYTTATVRQANAAAANQVEIVQCLDSVMDLTLNTSATGGGASASVGIGEDSTTTYVVGQNAFLNSSGSAFSVRTVRTPAIGRHVYSWNEFSVAVGTTTWNGAATGMGSSITGGLIGWMHS